MINGKLGEIRDQSDAWGHFPLLYKTSHYAKVVFKGTDLKAMKSLSIYHLKMSIFILEKIILPPKKSQFPAKNRVSPTMFTDPPPRYEDPQAQQYCLHHASKHSHQLKRENLFNTQNKQINSKKKIFLTLKKKQLKTENIPHFSSLH